MSRQSPLTVTYRSIREMVLEFQQEAEKKKAGAQACGAGSVSEHTARVENCKALVKLLKAKEMNKQVDIYELFQQVIK